jgi:hypothetical protein
LWYIYLNHGRECITIHITIGLQAILLLLLEVVVEVGCGCAFLDENVQVRLGPECLSEELQGKTARDERAMFPKLRTKTSRVLHEPTQALIYVPSLLKGISHLVTCLGQRYGTLER